MAFADAGISPDEVGYVNAHGTSTPLGDPAETRVLKLALGEEKARATPVSSTKGATGHCLGAAGAVEAIFTIFAVQRGILPPTINYEMPDPECDLDYIPNEARPQQVEIGVSNSFGFGGHNACVVFRRWDESLVLDVLRDVRRAALEEDRVPPDTVEPSDALAAPDDSEAERARAARGWRRSRGRCSSGSSRYPAASALATSASMSACPTPCPRALRPT